MTSFHRYLNIEVLGAARYKFGVFWYPAVPFAEFSILESAYVPFVI